MTPYEQAILRLDEIQDNRNRLDACPKHLFPTFDIAAGVCTCCKCGGIMPLLGLNEYVRGYIAHGGNGNDILPGWA